MRSNRKFLSSVLVQNLLELVRGDNYWESTVIGLTEEKCAHIGLHLAVFVEPYLKFILEGKKTVESRFSQYKIPPYNRVNKGDIILLKRSGGPIIGLCEVGEVWYYQLDPRSWKEVKAFSKALCAQDSDFWHNRQHASFATLMQVRNAREIAPLKLTKHDRRGWIVLHDGEQLKLDGPSIL